MARLKLKPTTTYGDVGDMIARLASAAENETLGPESTLLEEFRNLVDEDDEQIIGVTMSQMGADQIPEFAANSVFLNLLFDRTIVQGDHKLRLVNVVVPDFDGKLLEVARQGGFSETKAEGDGPNELNESLFDLSAVAKEAFGFIVICGCAG